jgi:chromosome partitioning protein
VGIDKRTVQSGSYEALLDVENGTPVILTNPKLKISILPSSPALAGAEIELVDELARETRLKRALESVSNRYDYIIIDCPPSLGLLTLNGLVAAANGVLIPVQCEYLALEGLGQLTQTVERVRNVISPDLQVRGVILTMYDSRTNLANDVVQEVRRYFPSQVFQTIIPRSVRLAEAPSYGIPISEYDPGSAGAEAYQALAKEILEQDRKEH